MKKYRLLDNKEQFRLTGTWERMSSAGSMLRYSSIDATNRYSDPALDHARELAENVLMRAWECRTASWSLISNQVMDPRTVEPLRTRCMELADRMECAAKMLDAL